MASVFMCGVEDVLFSGSRFVWTVTVAALRRWYAARLRACRQALRAWCGLRDVYQVKKPQKQTLLIVPAFPWSSIPGTWPGACSPSGLAAPCEDGVKSREVAALGRGSEGPEPGSELTPVLL